MKSLLLYNLYPRLYKNSLEWEKHLDKIIDMGFNAIFINPFHYPGFSGSIYAIKDYYLYNEQFFTKKKSPEDQLKSFIALCKKNNIDVLMDLVVNHTSIDAVLISTNKNWYKLDEKGEVERPGAWEDGKWITWGDLAAFDLDNSPDKNGLWNYLLNVCKYYLKLGFKGFRCDAAYQVSNDFWSFLIASIRNEYPDVYFIAETLGCTPVQIQSISSSGFDYIFNSSKWWNFNDEWCLEQYDLTKNISASISFPESHDTPRLMEETNGDEISFLQRIYFEAIFSKGFMITTGLEYGFRKRINSVKTCPEDWENTNLDYSKKIKKILGIKKSLIPLQEESEIKIIDHKNWANVFCFLKKWEDYQVLICLNKDTKNHQTIYLENIDKILNSTKIKDLSPEKKINDYITKLNMNLTPGELKIFAPENSILHRL